MSDMGGAVTHEDRLRDDYSVEETREHFLWQAAYHGGAARVLIRIVVQTGERPTTVNLDKLTEDIVRFARSGFRWADAYLTAPATGAPADLVALVLALQAHAKEHGWQDVDDPIADLLAWSPSVDAPEPPCR